MTKREIPAGLSAVDVLGAALDAGIQFQVVWTRKEGQAGLEYSRKRIISPAVSCLRCGFRPFAGRPYADVLNEVADALVSSMSDEEFAAFKGIPIEALEIAQAEEAERDRFSGLKSLMLGSKNERKATPSLEEAVAVLRALEEWLEEFQRWIQEAALACKFAKDK